MSYQNWYLLTLIRNDTQHKNVMRQFIVRLAYSGIVNWDKMWRERAETQ